MVYPLIVLQDYTIKYFILFNLLIISLFSNELQQYKIEADKLQLWNDKYWHKLLHIPKNNTSEIDSDNFFISKNGKTDPKSELLNTLENILSETNLDDNSTICKYPARTSWLKQKLNIKNLPKQHCTDYEKWLKEIDPTSVSFIFSSAHINSPASMFGHTFLRIDSSYSSKLLSHAINYAASADQTKENGFIFALKGLFGGYFGNYSLLPYYDKLKEYRDTEQRDIWEYDLNLTKEEVLMMIKHIWELKDSYSNYYFFDENCSYNMLWLLEVARPTINLRDKFTYHVSPPETIFAIEIENLVKEKHYRPSKRITLLAYEKHLTNEQAKIVKQLSLGTLKSEKLKENPLFSNKIKQNILEASLELTEYYYIQKKITKKEYLNIFHGLSKARAKLGKGEKISIDKPINPDNGHRQLKLSIGYKYNEDSFITFGIRPTYHDLTNNDNGFLKGTQIEFLNTNFQYNYEKENLQLDYINLINIKSIAPKTKLFDPLSWMTNWGFNREGLDNNLDFKGQISAGVSWNIDKKSYTYILLDGNILDSSYSNSAIGTTIGGVFYQNDKFKLNIESNYKIYDNKDTQKNLDITQSYYPKANIDIKLNYKFVEKFYKDQNIIHLNFNYFF